MHVWDDVCVRMQLLAGYVHGNRSVFAMAHTEHLTRRPEARSQVTSSGRSLLRWEGFAATRTPGARAEGGAEATLFYLDGDGTFHKREGCQGCKRGRYAGHHSLAMILL